MKTRDTKRRRIRTIPPPPGPEDGDEALVTYLHKYPAEELEKAGYLQEPTPEEIRDLEESVEHDIKRQKAKGLAKEYPQADYDRSSLADLLKCVPGLKHSDRKAMAQSLKVIADRASDMEEIMQRILKEKHSPAEIAELLLAFNEMINYVRSYGQNLSPKLCDVFDRLKGLVPTNQIAQHRNRTKPTRNGV
jgi:hypothetical protein